MAKHASKTAQDVSKRAQYCPMLAQDGLKRAEKISHDGFSELHEESPESTKRHKPMVSDWLFVVIWIIMFLGFRHLKTAPEVPGSLQEGPFELHSEGRHVQNSLRKAS